MQSHVRVFATPWTEACQAPLSMGFPRQKCWSGLSFLSPGDLLNSRIEPESSAMTGKFFKVPLRCGFDSWVVKILWRRKWQPTSAFLPGKSHGQRSLVGYSPQGHKESDMAEHSTAPGPSACRGEKCRGMGGTPTASARAPEDLWVESWDPRAQV